MKKKYSCLMYHQIESPAKNRYYVSPENFERQMQALVDAGMKSYTFDMPISNDHEYCMLTFDDGHKSNLGGAKYLHKKGLIGYFYVVKDFSLNDPDYLTEDEIREISSLGHIIGVHGKNHARWTKKRKEVLVAELRETMSWIEEITGKSCNTCSIPGGVYNTEVIKTIRENIPQLKYIRTSVTGSNTEGDTLLKSVGVHTDDGISKVLKMARNDNYFMEILIIKYKIRELLKSVYYLLKGIN